MMLIVENKRAYFEYAILETFVAGIKLVGTEVKSIKAHKVSLPQAYCVIDNGEVFIKGMHVSDYKEIKYTNHEPVRDRKLLLKKKEILNLQKKVKEKGLTIAPLKLFISDKGYIKLEIALVKGKKNYDKRESIKEKDLKLQSLRNN